MRTAEHLVQDNTTLIGIPRSSWTVTVHVPNLLPCRVTLLAEIGNEDGHSLCELTNLHVSSGIT